MFPQEGELSHLCPSQWTNVWKEGHFLGVACEMPKEEGSNPQAWEGPSQRTTPGPPPLKSQIGPSHPLFQCWLVPGQNANDRAWHHLPETTPTSNPPRGSLSLSTQTPSEQKAQAYAPGPVTGTGEGRRWDPCTPRNFSLTPPLGFGQWFSKWDLGNAWA